MATIKLGDLRNGEIEIKAISLQWEEYPTLLKDKLRSDKKIYLKIDRDNMKDFVRYYDSIKEGDLVEGILSNKQYWELLGIEVANGVFREKMSPKEVDELYFGWDFFNDKLPSSTKFIVQVN